MGTKLLVYRKISVASVVLLITGCSAIQVNHDAREVEISVDKPTGICKRLGEAAGSQGNYITGKYTSNVNLIVGARNDLRNNAAKIGGNYVWVQDTNNSSTISSDGIINTTIVGMVYRCQ
jgi:Domain of unknown function (DUF4156)